MEAYKFACTAREEKPDNDTTRLLEKADGAPLTRQEKDSIAETLWGVFGSHSPVYKLAGWAWNMRFVLPRILVKHTYDNSFSIYYAPDKTSLRKVLHNVEEMVYA